VASREDRKTEATEMNIFVGRGTERESSCSEVHKYRKEDIRHKIIKKKFSLAEFRNININGSRVYGELKI
jgi:hypothetical protein